MPLFSSSNKKKLRFIVEKKTPGLISRHWVNNMIYV